MGTQLTPAGWPRPRVDGWPIPWVSPPDNLAIMDSARHQAGCTGAVCAVCGEGYPGPVDAYILINTSETGLPPEDRSGTELTAMDNAVMHERCVRLALAWCPTLKALVEAGHLVVVRVPANKARPEMAEPDGVTGDGDPYVRAVYSGSDAEIVPLSELGVAGTDVGADPGDGE